MSAAAEKWTSVGGCKLTPFEHYGDQVLFDQVDVDDVPETCEALHVQQLPKNLACRMGEALDWP